MRARLRSGAWCKMVLPLDRRAPRADDALCAELDGARIQGRRDGPPDLGVKARVRVLVDILFGLRVTLLAIAVGFSFNVVKEAIMNNSNAIIANVNATVVTVVWCGAALLRGLDGSSSNPDKKERASAWPRAVPRAAH